MTATFMCNAAAIQCMPATVTYFASNNDIASNDQQCRCK